MGLVTTEEIKYDLCGMKALCAVLSDVKTQPSCLKVLDLRGNLLSYEAGLMLTKAVLDHRQSSSCLSTICGVNLVEWQAGELQKIEFRCKNFYMLRGSRHVQAPQADF